MPSNKTETKNDAGVFTVAPGRTVTHQPDVKSKATHYGPGETIELTAEEGERLRSLGFLLGEEGEVIVQPESAGPAVVEGAEIKES